jgi:hypothetical protein
VHNILNTRLSGIEDPLLIEIEYRRGILTRMGSIVQAEICRNLAEHSHDALCRPVDHNVSVESEGSS